MSIEKSEQLSALLKDRKYIRELGHYLKKQADELKDGKEDELKAQLNEVGATSTSSPRKNSGDPIPHQVLNARYHEQEAHIIAQAGVPGTVTIATNMAGRGTDIQLGGNARYRLRDWLKERRSAAGHLARRGQRRAASPSGSTTACATATNGSIPASSERIQGRMRFARMDLEEPRRAQPAPKDVEKRGTHRRAARSRQDAQMRARSPRSTSRPEHAAQPRRSNDERMLGWIEQLAATAAATG